MDGLDTPLVAIDLEVVDRNIARTQALADEHGLALRPHVKTHKLPLVAHRQLRAGAVGVACQKVSEAWVMATNGVGPILLTYPLVGAPKWRAAARLAVEFGAELCVDSVAGLEGLLAAIPDDASVTVRVDCDTGRWRTGVVEPADALALARQIERAPQLRFGGLTTHPAPDAAVAWFAEARRAFAADGIEIPVVSVGGTPEAFRGAAALDAATELRLGTSVYGDRACVAAGSHRVEDCALRVRATVVSVPSWERAIVDAGSKTLSSDGAEGVHDGGHGLIVGQPELTVARLSEEHGHVDMSRRPGALAVGDVVEIVPNHACAVSNLVDAVALHRSGTSVGTVPVAARGASR